MPPRRVRTGAPPRARGRGGVPPLSLQRPARGPLLAGRRRRNTPGRSMFVRLHGPDPARAPPANGPMPRPASMAICSTSSARAAAWSTSAMSPTRRGASSACRDPSRSPTPDAADRRRRPARRRRRGVCSPCRSRSPARSRKRICAVAASRHLHGIGSLRFHPRCYYRPDEHCADRDLAGDDRRRHRSRRAASPARTAPGSIRPARGKAPIDTPRRAMGHLLGNARPLRRGATTCMAAGEGIETMLSLRCVLPTMPMAAALSASSSRRHPVPADAAPALYRPRRRSGRRRRDGDS